MVRISSGERSQTRSLTRAVAETAVAIPAVETVNATSSERPPATAACARLSSCFARTGLVVYGSAPTCLASLRLALLKPTRSIAALLAPAPSLEPGEDSVARETVVPTD